MVIASAGRRIDAPDAPRPRFPMTGIAIVRERICTLLVETVAHSIVVSAACGADLLVLDEATKLGMRRRIVRLVDTNKFRGNSVVDRPGDWSDLYDRQVAEAEKRGDFIVLNANRNLEKLYAQTDERILDEAERLAATAPRQPLTALIVWDGSRQGPDDWTAHFGNLARTRNSRARGLYECLMTSSMCRFCDRCGRRGVRRR